MKVVNTIAKILVALAAVAGAVYVIATYGEKIVAWAKSLLKCCGKRECTCGGECTCNEEDIADETPAEEAVEEVVEEEVVAEEAPVVDEAEPVAEEADFEA